MPVKYHGNWIMKNNNLYSEPIKIWHLLRRGTFKTLKTFTPFNFYSVYNELKKITD